MTVKNVRVTLMVLLIGVIITVQGGQFRILMDCFVDSATSKL